MGRDPVDTREKILQAAIKLMGKKGFKATTTRAISQKAGVNESTLFRHFTNKKNILKAIVDKFSYAPILSKVVKEQVIWDLEQDLYLIAKSYHQVMNQNKDIIMIILNLNEIGAIPDFDQEIADIPRQLKSDLVEYFSMMKEKGNIIDINLEAQAMTFILMNFGFFFTRIRFGTKITDLTDEQFLKDYIKTFARGLKP